MIRKITAEQAEHRLEHVTSGGLGRDLDVAVHNAIAEKNWVPVWTLLRDQARMMRELAQHLEHREDA